MNDTLQMIKDWWVMLAATVATVAWLVRLESRGLQNTKSLTKESTDRKAELIALETRLETRRQEDLDRSREDRADTKQILQEMQRDIKLLLQQVGQNAHK